MFACFAVSLTVPAMGDPLSSADRELLLENLQELQDTVSSRVDARYRLAIEAYRKAMVDEQAVLAFYLQCVEKVNFTDIGKKPADFREWKKQQDDYLGKTSTRHALMHQLRWLVLTLRASSERADLNALAKEGMDGIDDVFNDKEVLSQQQHLLNQPVTGTVFAKAYDIDRVKSGNWPQSPLRIDDFYEKLVFPKYRTMGDTRLLRTAWTRRIQLEGVLAGSSNQGGSGGRNPGRGKGGGAPPPPQDAQESLFRFQQETLPNLVWEMEIDLFKAGDQRQAAANMVAHIKEHIASPKSKEWAGELRALLMPSDGTGTAPSDGTAPSGGAAPPPPPPAPPGGTPPSAPTAP